MSKPIFKLKAKVKFTEDAKKRLVLVFDNGDELSESTGVVTEIKDNGLGEPLYLLDLSNGEEHTYPETQLEAA
jgi:hypothetical protein